MSETTVIDDGGPAFPTEAAQSDVCGEQVHRLPHPGMTLRDYFAVRAPMPDAADVCDALGLEKNIKIGDEGSIGGDSWDDTLTSHWHELPRSKRFFIECQHRYAWADAMLRDRKGEK